MSQHFTDEELDDLRHALRANAETVCIALLGKPHSKHGTELRWNRKGSFSVVVRGPKRGQWFDHEASEGGDLLDLIRRERSCDFAGAVEFARGMLGGSIQHTAPKVRAEKRQREDAEAAREEARKRDFAARLASEAIPVAGTLGERYLIETRSIPRPAAGWPGSVRFHVGRCALLLAATAADGTVQAVQLVYLTEDAHKAPATGTRPSKQSFGPQQGAAVRLPGAGGPLLLAEGPETGLSVWAATGRETWVALGNIGKVDLPALRPVVACADDDARNSPGSHALAKRVSLWRSEGREIIIAYPWNPRRFDKSDFNDLIQVAGPEAVSARISGALSPPPNMPPGHKAAPLDVVRYKAGKAAAAFFRAALDYDPHNAEGKPAPVHAIRIDVGAGKTHAALHEAVKAIRDMRAKGDTRTIVFAIPRHALGAELVDRLKEIPGAEGITAAVWRGRQAKDPEQPGKEMCHDLEAVRDVQGIVGSVQDTLCMKGDKRCPFFELCGYQKQIRRRPDVWFVAHDLLFAKKPAGIGSPAALIVDESLFQKGLTGTDKRNPIELTLDSLRPEEAKPGNLMGINIDAERLRDVRNRLHSALSQHPLGPVSRDALLAADLTEETGSDGAAIPWRMIEHPNVYPGMPAEERRAAIAAYSAQKSLIRIAGVFASVRALLAADGPAYSGWLSLAEKQTDDGTVRVIRRTGRNCIGKGWGGVPALLMDANLRIELVRPYWPNVEQVADLAVQTPHMRVIQCLGRPWTKSSLVQTEVASEGRNKRRANLSQDLRAAIFREVRQTAGRVLVVAQKAVEEEWRALGRMPRNMEMAHHNAVAGRDDWRDVAKLIVIGKTQPGPDAVERVAGALTGAAVSQSVTAYERRDTALVLRDGDTQAVQADHHPDPVAEAIRWQICEGEIIQIIGRGRGSTRTADNPLEVQVWTDCPLPIEVDATFTWEQMQPTPADLMMAEGGVALENAAHAAAAYPNLWSSHKAAEHAFSRAKGQRTPPFPYKGSPYRDWGTPPVATYRKAGAGQKATSATYDPAIVPDVAGWLADKLGDLARCEVQDAPQAEPVVQPVIETPEWADDEADDVAEWFREQPPMGRKERAEISLPSTSLYFQPVEYCEVRARGMPFDVFAVIENARRKSEMRKA